MDVSEFLGAVRDAIVVMAERYARLVENVEDSSIPIPGSEWTIREAAVHTAGGGHRYSALARGDASPIPSLADKEYLDARMRSILADNPETDPKRLADQIRDGYKTFLDTTRTIPADQPIAYHAGLRPNVAQLAAALLGEPVLHGYDIATAAGVAWPIDPAHAALVLRGYRAFYPAALFQPEAAAGLEATYRIDITAVEPFFVRVVDGAFEELRSTHLVDCAISADPVTALLVITKRISQWPAIALGALGFGGDRPEVGPRFFDLFLFP
jgi:uncharacterized protein (TIGR03083 family)